MEVTTTNIEGLLILQPRVFTDDRGYFYESYQKEIFYNLGIDHDFVQDNESCSRKDVLRGLHFQAPPFAQGKLVRVIAGSVTDIAVDIRKGSPTFGQHVSIELSASNKTMFWIPPGFAHGFIAREDNTIFVYKCTAPYHKESEGSIHWNDPDLNIQWNTKTPLVSDKDNQALTLKALNSPF